MAGDLPEPVRAAMAIQRAGRSNQPGPTSKRRRGPTMPPVKARKGTAIISGGTRVVAAALVT